MLRLTLAQMRRSIGRLTAAGIAIAIGTAFVAATLVAGGVIERTSYDAVSASFADADLVVVPDDDVLSEPTLEQVRALPGVLAADGQTGQWLELASGARSTYREVTPRASHPRLESQDVVEGRLPETSGEVSLPSEVAERLRVGTGDELTLRREVWTPGDDVEDGGTWSTQDEDVVVVGLTEDSTGAFADTGGSVVAFPEDVLAWTATAGGEVTYTTGLVAVEDDVDAGTVRATVAEALPQGVVVRTVDEQAEIRTRELTGDEDVFTAIVLGFAGVALLVAGLVITNTFQVLVAQRTRLLALLRCVGADRSQLRRSVLTEATILGVGGSLVGIASGVALAQVLLTVLGGLNPEVPLPSVVVMSPAVVLAPLVVGTLVTVLAALSPARAATRVAPLAALRPADAPAVTSRAGRPRLVVASALLVVGVGLLLVAALGLSRISPVLALGVGLLGGALSFVGVLVGAVFWVPGVVGRVGALLGRTGPAARLASANAVRNPRRTAATSTALLIGVTLVAMMSTGAASARTTLGEQLEAEFPVDVALGRESSDAQEQVVTDALVETVAAVEGVETVLPLRTPVLRLAEGEAAESSMTTGAYVGSRDELSRLLRAPEQVEGLADDTIVVGERTAADLALDDGQVVEVSAVDEATGEPVGDGSVSLTVVVSTLKYGTVVTPATLDATGADVPVDEVWVRLADDADVAGTVANLQDAVAESPVWVSGAALERVMFQRVIDTLLAVVVGLLAAAVVIALIGVANTLSLSVIERRRESATLRAIGLSRRQLRGTLAVEGMVIAGVGALLGSVLGLLYGWAGSATVLSVVGDVRLEVPWRDLALVLVVAVGAGLLASVLPGRAAARTSPVQALAVD
ncbi:ABC transporter permease [Actinotalea sp. AC32]|nr:ABC transporter permease [Actinotalea sp. AC32]